jgi:RimJ/RimL family protein N-acetyltransferase
MRTTNLELIPHAPQHLRALIAGPERYETIFGVPPADGLRDFLISDDVSPEFVTRLEAATEADPWTHGFALVHAADRIVIGMVGFKGPRDADGMVEIAYGIVPAYRNKGMATEAAKALVRYAFASGGQHVRVVRAHTLPEPNASTRVLTKCGFERVGDVVDPEDGPVWRWEKYGNAGGP